MTLARFRLPAMQNLLAIPFLRHVFGLSAPRAVGVVTRLGAGLVTAKILGPENVGLIAAVSLVYAYSLFLQAGALDGMGLRVPYARGAGDTVGADLAIATAYRYVVAAQIPYAIIAFGITLVITRDPLVLFGLGSFLLAGLLTQLHQFRVAILRFDYRFRQLSVVELTSVVSFFALTIVFTVVFGVKGTITAASLFLLLPIAVSTLVYRVRMPSGFSFSQLRELMALGLPMVVIGFAYTMQTTIDRYFIIGSLGVDELGFYSIIITLATAMLLVPVSVNSLLTQYTRELYGKNQDTAEVWAQVRRFALTLSALFVPLLLLVSDLGFLVLRGYLTEFRAAVPLIMVLLLWAYFTAQFNLISTYLVVTMRRRWVLVTQTFGILLAVGLNAGAVALDLGLEGIAWATTLSAAAVVLGLLAGIYRRGEAGAFWVATAVSLGGGGLYLVSRLLDLTMELVWDDSYSTIVVAVMVRSLVAAVLLAAAAWAIYSGHLWRGSGPFLRREA